MKCPNCDYEFAGGQTCPNCRVDIALFTKTAAISDALYNKGLDRARVSDLTGAIGFLSKSIGFNKNNISARNLIGLCYYEIGYIGDALRHWVISNSILKEKNPARRYIDDVQKDEKTLKRLSDAVTMYNQALYYLKQKSDDMAIIQLKKAVELNPRFVDAYNMLSLCYLIQRNKEKAMDTIERALSIDVNNPVALNYFEQVFGRKQRGEAAARPARVPSGTPRPQPSYTMPKLQPKDNRIFGGGFRFGEILAFLVGAACIAILLFTLYVPARIKVKDAEIATVSAQKAAADQNAANAAADYNRQLTDKDTAYGDLQAKYNELQAQADVLALSEKIGRAETQAASSDFQGAADTLATIDAMSLGQDQAVRYASVRKTAWKALVAQYLADGVGQYESSEFDAAKTALGKAVSYIDGVDPADADAPKVYYYLGLTSEKLKEVAEALGYYQTVVDNYPNSEQSHSAQSKVDKLSAG
ncbi:MAG: tetratricopeptide repeat protein [Firmicutes bacterium]|nr:tetratricopeptide repeat protein [Bacillota bacterium]